MSPRDCDDCRACTTCGERVCIEGWPTNSCTHGGAVCDDCRPGECMDCALEVAAEVAA